MTKRSTVLRACGLALAAVAGLFGAVRAGGAAPAEPPADARLGKAFSLEVRAATVGSVFDKLSSAMGVRMDADRAVAGERITLYAPKATVGGLQDAVGALYQSGWSAVGLGEETRYHLRGNESLLSRAEQLRTQRRQQFVTRLLALEQEVGNGSAAAAAARLKVEVERRRPDLPQSSLDQITADYVSQAMLVGPLRFGVAPTLVRSGFGWAPLNRLSDPAQRMATSFYLAQGSSPVEANGARPASAPAANLDPNALLWPRARIEYRLLYGDRWAGNVLLTRIGTSDSWANALLSSALFPLPDYGSLYTDVIKRPTDATSYKQVDVKIDPTVQSWDQVLSALSKGANINVLSDAYLRPDVFRPVEPKRILSGYTLTNLLDHIADYYGCVWWKEGDFYIFRNRMWAEEQRVSVPDRLLQTMGSSLAENEGLSPGALNGLAALTEEQLLTLHLYGSAVGNPDAPASAFDFEEASLVHAGFMLLSQMTEAQRTQARGRGLPYTLMTPVQQYLFASLAYDRGIALNPYEVDAWGFQYEDRFDRRKLGAGWAEVGQITMDFNCGPSGNRRAKLAARVPAYEKATKTEEPKPQ